MSVEHRRARSVVTVLDARGEPLRSAEVSVEQTRHAFAFGNIGFDFIPLAAGLEPASVEPAPVEPSSVERSRDQVERSRDQPDPTRTPTGQPQSFGAAQSTDLEALADLWLSVFNTATLPFYWRGFEPIEGQPDTDRLLATAKWFASKGVTVKGHPLTWHTLAPEWLLSKSVAEVERAQRARIRREVTDFAGVIDTWDAINEVVIMPVFEAEENGISKLARSIGRIPMIRLAFDEARAANPGATLVLNDFDLSSAYECLIEGVLEAGIQVDAIGLQTHMHQGYWGEDTMLAMVDRFARYGLPLHLTETTLVSGHLMPSDIVDLNDYVIPSWPSTPEGEARQADEIERHYRSLVGHPSVEAINYWGITDDGAWLGAPGGLVRSDGTPKPAFHALHRLIKDEWWMSRTTLRTDADGRLPVEGFFGEYAVSANGSSAGFTLAPEHPTQVARLG